MSRLRSGKVPSRCPSMNRGAVSSGAGDLDGRVEALRMSHRQRRPSCAGAQDEGIGFLERPRQRLLDQHRRARLEKRRGNRRVRRGWRRHDDGIRHANQRGGVLDDRRAVRVGDLRARWRFVSTTPIRSTPGMPARIRAWCRPRCPTPMTATRMWLSNDLSPDDRDTGGIGGLDHSLTVDEQRLASVHRERRGANLPQHLDGAHTDDRHVESHVLLRLGHLDEPQARPGQWPARRSISSVPSIASTATTAPSFTATDWPTSSAAMASAMRYRTRGPSVPRATAPGQSASRPVPAGAGATRSSRRA